MKTLIGTSILMIAAVAGLWMLASEHADSSDYQYVEPTLHEEPGVPTDEEIVVRVNGQPITMQDFELALASFPESARGVMFTGAGKKVIAEELIRLELLARKAEIEGLSESETVREQLRRSRLEAEFIRKNILAQAAVRAMVERQESQGSLQELYERLRKDFETVQVRQIIVTFRGSRLENEAVTRSKDEARARAVEAVARLRGGAPFESVLRDYGDNPGNAELGPLRRDSTPPDFAEAIFSLDEGGVSEPVETQWGFHVFRLESRSTPAFEEVGEQLEQQSRHLWTRVAVEELREEAEVEFNEEFFRN